MKDLSNVLTLMRFLHRFQHVERIIPVPGKDRKENDAEHSYFLAVLAWYIIDSQELQLDKSKVITYALVHDLVEIYAGDVYAYEEDADVREAKEERERKALQKIAAEFPEFGGLHEAIHRYEERSDEESKFVYALDKVAPMLTVYLDSDDRESYWKKQKVPLDKLRAYKDAKVATSPEVKKLYDSFIEMLEKKEEELFSK